MAISREQPMRPYLDALGEAFDNYEIPDGSVTTTKIADESVTTAKIANGAVTLAKLDGTLAASIPMSPLTNAEIDAITQ